MHKTFGFNISLINSFEERFECFYNTPLKDQDDFKWRAVELFFNDFFPQDNLYKSKLEVNIFYLDLISTYRGWRHSKGLPVRGQRTWSNSWSAYRSNLIMREVKLRVAKKFYGNIAPNEINMAYLAEDINLLWKAQWDNEWKAAKKKLKLAEKKNSRTPLKIDLASMAKNNIILDDVTNKKLKANKKKRIVQKNVFTLGFDPGFTKFVLKSYSAIRSTYPVMLVEPKQKIKKSPAKKKLDIKAQKMAHKKKKKSKKSVWD